MRTLPLTTSFADVEIRGVRGQPIFNYYKLVCKTLEQFSENQSLRNYLARPDADLDNGVIAWSTDADGQIKKFSALSDADKEKVFAKVSQIQAQIRSISEKITKKDRALKEVFDAILLITNLQRCLFVVGDDPVVCEWGCNANAEESEFYEPPKKSAPAVASEPRVKVEPVITADADIDENAKARVDITAEENSAVIQEPNKEQQEQAAPSAKEDNQKDPKPKTKNNKIFQQEAAVIYKRPKRTPQNTVADFSKYVALFILLLQILIIFLMGWMRDHESFFSTESLQATIEKEEVQLRAEINKLRKQAYSLSLSCPVSIATEVTDVGGTQTLQQRVQLAGKDLSGSLAIALTWNGKHDLDLYVEEPGGVTTGVGIAEQQASQTGGMIDLDMNNIKKKASMNDNPVEIVKWQRPPPLGAYTIGLRLYRVDYSTQPKENIDFHLVVTRDGKVIMDKSSNIALSLDCKNQNNKCATVNVAEFEVSR